MKRAFHLSGAALFALIAATPAFAQDAAPAAAEETATADTVDSGDIIVTAQKRSENLQKVPAAISVISAEQFDARGGVNVQSLQQLVPSLNFKESATTIDSSLFLRGVGTINFSIAAEPSVGFVVDGVTYARSGEAFGDLYDVERIEVLRGPQGTLFGKNSSAGVVNIVTKRPGDKFGGYVEAQATTDDEYKLKAAIDIPLGEGISSRFTGTYANFDGTVRNVTLNRTVNGYERYGIRGMIVAEATDALTFTLIGDWRHTNADCCAEVIGMVPGNGLAGSLSGIKLAAEKTREIRQNTLTETRETSWGGSLQADLDIGSAGTLTSITAYRDYKNYGIRDGDFIDQVYVNPPGITGRNQLNDFGPQPSTTFTQEVRLASPGNQTVEYVLGGFYYKAKQERTFERDDIVCTASTLPPLSSGLIPCAPGSSTLTFPSAVGNFGSTIENVAAYGNVTVRATDWLRLIAGGRFTHDRISAFNVRSAATGAGPGLVGAAANYRLKTSQSDFSGKLGIQADITNGLMAYATFSQGYKGPAFNVFFNQNDNQLAPIAAETSNAYELGTKFKTADGSFTLNTAVFYAKYDHFQANSFVNLNGSVVTQLTDAGSVSTKGVEIESVIRPARNFTINAGIAYTDAQIDKFNIPAGSPATATDRRGEQLPLAPTWKGNIGATWKIETGGFANVEIGSNISLTSDQVSSLQAGVTPGDLAVRRAITIDGYALVDANIALVDPNGVWRVNFIGRNLTDKSYASLITTGGPGGSYRYLLPRDVDRYFGVAVRFNY
ncbi:TonB-dependent receptor [Sphingomonas sp. ERG5]|uniref:TonB-dependent receptor n=1 Tax=Sphingomonas sp. ERG5 TaxID=1381597 RepID=UPI00054BBD3D|nr:TonB-dependent receptor [Sphingomonas sp. ERG5]